MGQSVRTKMRTSGIPAANSNGLTTRPERSCALALFDAVDAGASARAAPNALARPAQAGSMTIANIAASPVTPFNTALSPTNCLPLAKTIPRSLPLHFTDINRVRRQRYAGKILRVAGVRRGQQSLRLFRVESLRRKIETHLLTARRHVQHHQHCLVLVASQ